jgi:hypothetical protein
MAKTTAKAAVVMATMVTASAMAAGRAWGDQTDGRTVVLHLDSRVSFPANVLDEAQKMTVAVYERIGVRIVWTDGLARPAAPDGAEHLDVIVLTKAYADSLNPDRHALGQGGREAKRAYIFFTRVASHARNTNSDLARVLALVVAHEVGHMLLPEHNHAAAGLMRANFDGRIVTVPDLAPAQAMLIRTLLAGN